MPGKVPVRVEVRRVQLPQPVGAPQAIPVIAPPAVLPALVSPISIAQRPVVPAPVKAIQRPTIVLPPPKQAVVRAGSYVYIPGLARDALVLTPCRNTQAFKTRIATVFGLLRKAVWGGSASSQQIEDDEFMTGAVRALCDTKGAVPLNCGCALRWVPVSYRGRQVDAQSKAYQLLGTPQQNILALNAGDKPKAPKALQYGPAVAPACLAAEYIAQPKGALVVGKIGSVGVYQSRGKTLAHLEASDMLYIVGHGSAGGATLTYKCAPPGSHPVKDSATQGRQAGMCESDEHQEKWHVDANTLAALLVDEGLPTTHQNIEMVMCFGAGLSLSSEQTCQPFCQRLAAALRALGYEQIKVRGAKGLVLGPDLAVNPSLKQQGKKLVIDPKQKVALTDPRHKQLFVTFTGY